MGAHSKPSRIRQVTPAVAAAPVLAGTAAAFCLAPTAAASAAVAPTASTAATGTGTTGTSSTVSAAAQQGQKSTQLLSAEKTHTRRTTPATYKVRSGDTLSAIAGRYYHDPAAWPVIYWGNRNKIHWANDIKVGQVLRIPAEPKHLPKAPGSMSPGYTPRHAAPAQTESTGTQTSTSTDGYYGGAYPGGAFGACVVARESGGDPNIWNASGHYGLYQFSEATWVAYGGSPAEFGHATVAEQNAVFATALADGGEDNWAPYDGC